MAGHFFSGSSWCWPFYNDRSGSIRQAALYGSLLKMLQCMRSVWSCRIPPFCFKRAVQVNIPWWYVPFAWTLCGPAVFFLFLFPPKRVGDIFIQRKWGADNVAVRRFALSPSHLENKILQDRFRSMQLNGYGHPKWEPLVALFSRPLRVTIWRCAANQPGSWPGIHCSPPTFGRFSKVFSVGQDVFPTSSALKRFFLDEAHSVMQA